MARLIRGILGTLAIAGVLAAAACAAPAAAPTAPSKPTQAPAPAAKPSPADAPSAKPTASEASKPAATPVAKPAASADWKAEWDKTVAAAKKEGKVVISGGVGTLFRNHAMAFEKDYPEIKVEFEGSRGSVFGPKVLAERQGGQYNWDVNTGGATTMLTVLRPNGVIDPLRPALMLPEVLDDSKWLGGFESGWMDKDRTHVYGYGGYLRFIAYVNRQVIPESEFNKIEQLVDPKFKGKVVSIDPRESGPAGPCMANLMTILGEDWLRKLYNNDLVVMKGGREVIETTIRGRYPVGICQETAVVEILVQEGVAGHVIPLDDGTPASVQLTGGENNVSIFNRAPHPNAAKVYVNWLLSKKGQEALVKEVNLNSRRLDAPGPPETQPNPNVKYPDMQKEEYIPAVNKARDIAKELLQ